MSKTRKGLVAVCFVVIAAAVGYIAFYYTSLARQKALAEQLREAASAASLPANSEESAAASTEPVSIPIDFAALQQQYPDIYAWIEIPGTEVNYPILRHPTDDRYYLDHNLDGSKGYPGCLFTESSDALDFSDFNTILYGHNMKDGTMFGGLKKYRDSAYLQEHREIIVYTPTEKRVYTVFAAVVYSDAYISAKYDDGDLQARQAFLDSLDAARSINNQVLDDVAVTPDSQIITLSTCIGGQPNNRYLIEAVYTDAE